MNRRALAAGVLALLALVAAWLASPDLLLSRVDWLLADPLRFAVALCALAVVRPLLAWPTSLLGVLAGYAYGVAGAPLALALITLTSVPPYRVALRGREGWGAGRASGLTRRAAEAGERAVGVAGDFRSVAASRLLPTPSDAVSVAAGLAGVRLRPYLVGTAVGEVPWAVAATVAGASAGRVAAGGVGAAFDPRLVAAAALAGLLLLAGPAYRRYVNSRSGA
ncbi:TVP38/TMEM64 family protein [Halorarum salinum]|uniref:TVP38/TMEM64 family protein n=1 Tax=Halorarum salinum TaxID=2743089 RepID=A0A7D5QAL9_9EURY|nr:VTT domain-containing protein [Halobaculum salinum]QLG61559.1 TVP38/TMEM64 family protein [Halobaculum salinum]